MARVLLWTIVGVVGTCAVANAADEPARFTTAGPAIAEGSVPIEKLIAAFAASTHKRVVVDPRVRANVLTENVNMARPTLAEFQSIMAVYGFVAVDVGGIVNVVPDANMRSLPLPVVAPNASGIGDDEIVISVITSQKVAAVGLVPILRPLLPQAAHLAANPQTNQLVIAGRFGNVKTIAAIVKELERNAPATEN
jgi:general secretion pathway protein D